MTARKKKEEELGFDDRLERLETLVAELEEGGLGLEPAIEKYQEGIGLLKGCHEVLAGYRKQVEELTRGAEQALRPFAEDPDAGGGAPGAPGPAGSSAAGPATEE